MSDYESKLNELNLKELKSFIKMYNLHTRIVMTKKKKNDLIQEVLKHTEYINNKVHLKSDIINDLPIPTPKKEKVIKPKVIKPKEVKPKVVKPKVIKPKKEKPKTEDKLLEEYIGIQINDALQNANYKILIKNIKKAKDEKIRWLHNANKKEMEKYKKENPVVYNFTLMQYGNDFKDFKEASDEDIKSAFEKHKKVKKTMESIKENIMDKIKVQKVEYKDQPKVDEGFTENKKGEVVMKQDLIDEKEQEDLDEFNDKYKLVNMNEQFFKQVDKVIDMSPYKFIQFKNKLIKEFEKNITEGSIDFIKNNKQLINSKYVDVIKSIEKGFDPFESIRGAQKGSDFYPTPTKCIKVFEDVIKQARTILEPTAGLGYIVNEIRRYNPEAKITAIEWLSPFVSILRLLNPDVNINPDDNIDFLKYNPDKVNYDMIFINPPFTRGNDKRYYFDFLFHCLYLLNRDEAGVLTDLVFISPEIVDFNKYKDKSIFLLQNILESSLLGKPKLKEILDRYKIKYTAKDLDYIKKGDYDKGEDINNKLDEIFGFQQGQFIDMCVGFGGTKTSAKMYHIIGSNLNSKSVIKKIDMYDSKNVNQLSQTQIEKNKKLIQHLESKGKLTDIQKEQLKSLKNSLK